LPMIRFEPPISLSRTGKFHEQNSHAQKSVHWFIRT
jgi:hypothetical protein